uniref:Sulfotransferase domain-containing protein n=1 Tax=Attheya septentrionalis TaxID=420275 RepID=A0A7S2UB27_9STRA|mmetsp:Transcript_18234/g.33040  ORF Transcript_18234/g.33040 Transcript_18234/m.33040 type:complete len:439 (+) Transcript_18234:71-1387(+)
MRHSPTGKRMRKPSRSKGKPALSNFNDYLSFGYLATRCIGIFLVSYMFVLMCLLPMLKVDMPQVPAGATLRQRALNGAHLPHVKEAAKAVKKRLGDLTVSTASIEKNLLALAAAEFDAQREIEWEQEAQKGGKVAPILIKEDRSSQRDGFIILGMHRSGTSMLAGLLHQGAGYQVGEPLIEAGFDNEKGFFEFLPAVLQNDEFLYAQDADWSSNVIVYDPEQGLRDIKSGVVKFKEGKKALTFLNSKESVPWMQKDPRMCVTLPTWLPLLNTEPAIVFSYRHPLEVAMSLKKRQKFLLEQGLRIWIVYNMRAVQNSRNLCRIVTSQDKILRNPKKEVQRVSDELTSKCGVPTPLRRIKQSIVDEFVDPKLQHNKKDLADGKILMEYGEGCVIRDFDSDLLKGDPNKKNEEVFYLMAMKVYCDLKSGDAFKEDYKWPTW